MDLQISSHLILYVGFLYINLYADITVVWNLLFTSSFCLLYRGQQYIIIEITEDVMQTLLCYVTVKDSRIGLSWIILLIAFALGLIMFVTMLFWGFLHISRTFIWDWFSIVFQFVTFRLISFLYLFFITIIIVFSSFNFRWFAR